MLQDLNSLSSVGFVGKIVSSSENLNLWPPPPQKLCSHGATVEDTFEGMYVGRTKMRQKTTFLKQLYHRHRVM